MKKWEDISQQKGIPPNPEIMRQLSEEVSKECRYLIYKNKELPNPLEQIVAKIPEVAQRMGEEDFTADTFLTDLYYGQSKKEGHKYEEFVDTRYFETNKYFIFLRSIIGEANNSNTQKLLKSKLMTSISIFNKCCIIYDVGDLGEELGNLCFPQDEEIGRSRNPTKSVNMFRTTLDAIVRTQNAPKAVVQALCNVLWNTRMIFGDAEELKGRDESANFQAVFDAPKKPEGRAQLQRTIPTHLENEFTRAIASPPSTPALQSLEPPDKPFFADLAPVKDTPAVQMKSVGAIQDFGKQFEFSKPYPTNEENDPWQNTDTPRGSPVEEQSVEDFGVTAYSPQRQVSPEPQRHDVERTMNNERVAEAQNNTSGYLPMIALLGIGGFLILALHKRK